MASVAEHGRVVLSGIIPNRIDLLDGALKALTVEHFADQPQKLLFRFLGMYYQTTNGVMSHMALGDFLAQYSALDASTQEKLYELYDEYKTHKVDDTDYLWSVHELEEEFKSSKIKTALVNTMEILQTGVVLKNGEVIQGPESAKEFLTEAMAEVDGPLG